MGSVPLQLAGAFGLLVQCRETSSNHPLLSMTMHTLRQAVCPGEPLYPACMQFTTQDYKEVCRYTVPVKSLELLRFYVFERIKINLKTVIL